ncbi:MAG: sugar phosphate nucleotidyltransferase [Syntrophomonas sp.]
MTNMISVVLAGGQGVRLWPESTAQRPKQLCDFMGRGSLLAMTLKRLQSLGSLVVVCGDEQKASIEAAAKELRARVLTEPMGRNTAPAVGLTLAEGRYNGEEVLGFFPADHYIQDDEKFRQAIRWAEKLAREQYLVTIGIVPTYAQTGYGYIERIEGSNNHLVKAFHEKPSIEDAIKYVESGRYLWNAGIFVASVNTWLQLMQEYMPELYLNIKKGTKAYRENYPRYSNISIDYGIAEKCSKMAVVEGDFGWSDVGSWDSLAAVLDHDDNGNVLLGTSRAIDTSNCLAKSCGKNVVLFGIQNLVVVETEDTIMVCPRERSQDIKGLVDVLKLSQ